MRGYQIKKLLENIDIDVISHKTPVERAVFILEFLNTNKQKVDKLISSAMDFKTASNHSHADFIDQKELQDEIQWSINIVDRFLKLGHSDFFEVPNDNFSESEVEVVEKVFRLIIVLIEG